MAGKCLRRSGFGGRVRGVGESHRHREEHRSAITAIDGGSVPAIAFELSLVGAHDDVGPAQMQLPPGPLLRRGTARAPTADGP